MTTPKTATPPKSNAIGTMLLMGATAIVTAIAVTKKKAIVEAVNTGITAAAAMAQKVADEGLEALTPGKQNGAAHTAAPTGH